MWSDQLAQSRGGVSQGLGQQMNLSGSIKQMREQSEPNLARGGVGAMGGAVTGAKFGGPFTALIGGILGFFGSV